MDSIEIGLWVTGGMLVMVVLGMRVAFAAGMAGFVGQQMEAKVYTWIQ